MPTTRRKAFVLFATKQYSFARAAMHGARTTTPAGGTEFTQASCAIQKGRCPQPTDLFSATVTGKANSHWRPAATVSRKGSGSEHDLQIGFSPCALQTRDDVMIQCRRIGFPEQRP